MTINLPVKWVVIACCVIVVLCIGSTAYFHFKTPSTVNPVQYTAAPEIKETVKIKRVKVPGPPSVAAIEKPAIVEKLKLPDSIAKDDNKQIIATATIPAHEGETDAIAILDTKTGEGSIQVKQEDPPLFAFTNKKEIGGRFGYATTTESGIKQQVDAYARWTVFRVWRVHFGLYGEVNSRPEGKGSIDVSYRW